MDEKDYNWTCNTFIEIFHLYKEANEFLNVLEKFALLSGSLSQDQLKKQIFSIKDNKVTFAAWNITLFSSSLAFLSLRFIYLLFRNKRRRKKRCHFSRRWNCHVRKTMTGKNLIRRAAHPFPFIPNQLRESVQHALKRKPKYDNVVWQWRWTCDARLGKVYSYTSA